MKKIILFLIVLGISKLVSAQIADTIKLKHKPGLEEKKIVI